MREAIRRRLASEEGVSLVEIMVAFAVLALILLGFAATLTSSLHAIVGNESRTKANALANDYLENLRHTEWDDLLDLEAAGPDTEAGQGPESAYTVTTEVAWADDDSIGGSDDYLEFTVTVDWEDLGVARTVTHEARLSPPAKEVAQAATVRSIRTDAEIGYLRRNPDDSSVHGRLDYRVEFDGGEAEPTPLPSNEGVSMLLTTTESVDSIDVELIDRLDVPRTASLREENEPEGTEWELRGGDTNNWRYRNGDNTFTFTITTESGDTFTMTKVVRYVFKHVEPFDPDDPITADPEVVCLDAADNGTEDVELTAGFWGLTIDDRVEVTGAGLDASQEWLADHTAADLNGSTFAFVLPEGHEYPAGTSTTVEFLGIRGFDGKTNLDDDSDDPDRESPPMPAEVELELLRPDDDGYDDECGTP